MSNCTVVLSRSPRGEPVKARLDDEVAEALVAAGLDVLIVPHLYYLREGQRAFRRVVGLAGPVVVVSWLLERAAEHLTRYIREHGDGEGADAIRGCVCLTDCVSAQGCLERVLEIVPSPGAEGSVEDLTEAVSSRWYPVLDKDACLDCGQCLEFCLFDVYTRDEARGVTVQRPDNCKDGCPACARVCPEGAIIFPHCEIPVIAGARPEGNGGAASTSSVASSGAAEPSDVDRLIDELESMEL